MWTLLNSFSLNMLPVGHVDTRWAVHARQLPLDEVRYLVGRESFVSAVGHADLAAVLSKQLGEHVEYNRVTVAGPSPEFPQPWVVAQYSGPRLAEGTTTLPAGATIVYWRLDLQETPGEPIPWIDDAPEPRRAGEIR